MYPNEGYLCIAPFYDEQLYSEQVRKVNFWDNTNFHGFNLSSVKEQALDEKLRQPIIEIYDPTTQYFYVLNL